MPLRGRGPRLRLAVLYFSLQLALLGALSLNSDYVLRRPGRTINFAIATMLTPLGLLDNFLVEVNPPLRPFYFHVSERHGVFDDPWCLLLTFTAAALALAMLIYIRRA